MRLRRLTAVLVVSICFFGSSHASFFSDVLDKIKEGLDFVENIPDDIINKIEDSDLKKAVEDGDLSKASTAKTREIPFEVWEMLPASILNTLSEETLKDVANQKPDKMPYHVWATIQELNVENLSMNDLYALLNNDDPVKQTYGLREALENKLGDPEDWTPEEIDLMDDFILKIDPKKVAGIKNKESAKKVLRLMKDCRNNPKGLKCPEHMVPLHMEVSPIIAPVAFGDYYSWTEDDLRDADVDIVNQLPCVVKKLRKETIIGAKAHLKQLAWDERMLGRKILEVFLEEDPIDEKTSQEIKDYFYDLGNLKAFAVMSDVDSSKHKDADIKHLFAVDIPNTVKNLGLEQPPQDIRSQAEMKLNDLNEDDDISTNEINQMDIALLGNMKVGKLTEFVDKLSTDKLDELGKTPSVFRGPGRKSEMRILANKHMESHSMTNMADVFLSEAPATKIPISKNDRMQILEKVTAPLRKMDDSTIQLLIEDVSASEVKDINYYVKNFYPSLQLSGLSDEDLKEFCGDLPAGSAGSRYCSKKKIKVHDPLTAVDVKDIDNHVISSMDAEDVNKMKKDNFFDLMFQMSLHHSQPLKSACRALSVVFASYIRNTTGANEDEVMKQLSPSQIQMAPPCVIASLSEENLKSMNDEQAKSLAFSIGKSFDSPQTISLTARKTIFDKAVKYLESSNSDKMLSSSEVYKLMSSLNAINPESIGKLEVRSAMMFLYLADQSPFCFTAAQRQKNAVLLKKIKGDPSSWHDLDMANCLITSLSEGDLAKVPKVLLEKQYCPLMDYMAPNAMDDIHADCKAAMGDTEYQKIMDADMKVMKLKEEIVLGQIDANSNRRKRATTALTCDQVKVKSDVGLSESELKALSKQTVMECLPTLGKLKISPEAAKSLLDKVKDSKHLDELTKVELKDLGTIILGMTKSDVAEISKDQLDLDVIQAFGAVIFGTDATMVEVQKALVTKALASILDDDEDVSDLSSSDVAILNQLICGLDTDDIDKLTDDVVKASLPTLTNLKKCPKEVTAKLFLKLTDSDIFGDIDDWDSTKVGQIGLLANGINPQQLEKIPPAAWQGISVESIQSIMPDSLKAISKKQISAISPTAAVSLKDEQKNALPSDLKAQFEKHATGFTKDKDNIAAGLSSSAVLTLLATFVAHMICSQH